MDPSLRPSWPMIFARWVSSVVTLHTTFLNFVQCRIRCSSSATSTRTMRITISRRLRWWVTISLSRQSHPLIASIQDPFPRPGIKDRFASYLSRYRKFLFSRWTVSLSSPHNTTLMDRSCRSILLRSAQRLLSRTPSTYNGLHTISTFLRTFFTN